LRRDLERDEQNRQRDSWSVVQGVAENTVAAVVMALWIVMIRRVRGRSDRAMSPGGGRTGKHVGPRRLAVRSGPNVLVQVQDVTRVLLARVTQQGPGLEKQRQEQNRGHEPPDR
jgi:hypothetical protein